MEDTNPTTEQSDLNELQAQCRWLRKQVFTILVLLIVVSGTFNLYLWRQVRYTRADLTMIRPQAAQIIAEYNQNSGPRMDTFVRQLTEFARSNRDFAAILAKYGVNPATNVAPAKPAPAPAAVPKN
jgi:hypothetical protein